jgi:PRTRC genetic system protein A
VLLNHSIVESKSVQNSPPGYLWAGNGIFRSVNRTEFNATIAHKLVTTPGLTELDPSFELLVSKVPPDKVKGIIDRINQYPDLEQLFYLYWRGTAWEVICPEQECTPTSCISLEQYPEPAAIEIHSHGSMGAFFSATDNKEENGCRISTVIGRTNNQLEIVSRVCAHGLFLDVASDQIYQNINTYCRHVIPF